MKQLAILFAILISMMLFVWWSGKPENLQNLISKTAEVPKTTKEVKTINVGNTRFNVEIAKTEEERRVGLAKYESLQPDFSMLFVLQNDSKPNFWMKGVKFPIDIIWIDNNTVVDITANVPTVPENTPEAQIPRYSPKQLVDFALEVAAGTASAKGIKITDKVELPTL